MNEDRWCQNAIADPLSLILILDNSRVLSVFWDQLGPRLASATPEQRKNVEIIGGGYGLHWEELDEDLSVNGLIRDFGEGLDHSEPF